MAIAKVQPTNTDGGATGLTLVTSYTSSVALNSLLMMRLFVSDASVLPSTVVDNRLNVWSLRVSAANETSLNERAYWYTAISGVAGALTITVTYPSSIHSIAWLDELSGYAASYIGVSNTTQGVAANPSLVLTGVTAGSAIFGAAASSGAFTQGSSTYPYSLEFSGTSFNNETGECVLTGVSAGNPNVAFVSTGPQHYSVSALEILAAGGGGTDTLMGQACL